MAGNVPINTGSFAKAIWPGINTWYGKGYSEYPVEYTDIYTTYQSRRNYEEDVGVSSFGLFQVKQEGEPIAYDSEIQGFVTRYVHVVYALGFVVTREMFEDDLYDVVGQRRAKGLSFSLRQTKEITAADVFNNGFNSSFVGGDGVELFSTAHPNVAGGTWSNELTTASDLSEAALEQACIDIMKWEDDAGLRISIMPQCLLVPPDLVFEAERILMSPYRVGTANNDVNALFTMGKFPKGIKVNHYLTDPDAWFILTNAPNGFKHFERRADEFSMDNDFDTENAKFKASGRWSFGFSDPRGGFASPGA